MFIAYKVIENAKKIRCDFKDIKQHLSEVDRGSVIHEDKSKYFYSPDKKGGYRFCGGILKSIVTSKDTFLLKMKSGITYGPFLFTGGVPPSVDFVEKEILFAYRKETEESVCEIVFLLECSALEFARHLESMANDKAFAREVFKAFAGDNFLD